MSIDQERVIDFLAVNKDSGEVCLFITDHLPWDNPKSDHLIKLQAKIYAYLDFIQSGEIYEKNPSYKEKPLVIIVMTKYPLSGDIAEKFIEKMTTYIQWEGFDLRFEYKPTEDE